MQMKLLPDQKNRWLVANGMLRAHAGVAGWASSN